MKNKNLANLLKKVNAETVKQSEQELAILNDQLSDKIKGGCTTNSVCGCNGTNGKKSLDAAND